jgi:hypothetical protein
MNGATPKEKTYIREKVRGYMFISRELPLSDEPLVEAIKRNIVKDAERECERHYPGKPIQRVEITKFEEQYYIHDPLGTAPATVDNVDMYGEPSKRIIMYEVFVFVEE